MSVKLTLGVSLKMYFGYEQTINWSRQVADIVRQHPLLKVNAQTTLFTFPSAPVIGATLRAFEGTAMQIGAQNIAPAGPGAWTGETSAAMVAEIGGKFVEIGHAERRRYFQEDDALICRKAQMALENGLTPVICIGEPQQLSISDATAFAIQEASVIIQFLQQQTLIGDLIFAWEPQWAIGAPQPASAEYIRSVCSGLRAHLSSVGGNHRVIYGGSAGPGLLSALWPYVDGLFLGRFAHQPAAIQAILDEAYTLLTQAETKENA
ncbi:TPA: triosephosphate isomerase [Klebsiella quasipneumoniae subsp. quasipneumoniae]|uniref:triose-phosphate isomerase family protein n=1 Tax=Klebsiella quasipneumoniae TaxID=1463165 RepID=UPI00298ADA35|nr:triosephosphate isomerase [Klebsiella quasipneumoniae subsp. quasipneumoniae]HBR1675121.1 triosephosphate isomerase [Klebsiella quasipneumoniae subsp. quasipneumoniae]HBV4315528.1 triosephosphate isomerase [Klebsiella quasipneumoniae]HCI6850633.1 triosephosphate isomerase [Klebsiella quasipneumoniae subsp. quasipneumoniae]HDH1545536.1 triosephosphate isomerase [Klebsiella quasipneumoniae subsp. quasipneumoniae]